MLWALLASASAQAWGPTGHRIGGKLAETWLTPATRDHIKAILGRESLAQAANWADEMRSNPSQYWQKGEDLCYLN